MPGVRTRRVGDVIARLFFASIQQQGDRELVVSHCGVRMQLKGLTVVSNGFVSPVRGEVRPPQPEPCIEGSRVEAQRLLERLDGLVDPAQ